VGSGPASLRSGTADPLRSVSNSVPDSRAVREQARS
jgi:hypothetical protein